MAERLVIRLWSSMITNKRRQLMDKLTGLCLLSRALAIRVYACVAIVKLKCGSTSISLWIYHYNPVDPPYHRFTSCSKPCGATQVIKGCTNQITPIKLAVFPYLHLLHICLMAMHFTVVNNFSELVTLHQETWGKTRHVSPNFLLHSLYPPAPPSPPVPPAPPPGFSCSSCPCWPRARPKWWQTSRPEMTTSTSTSGISSSYSRPRCLLGLFVC